MHPLAIRVIDELMGHAQSGQLWGERGSVVGRRHRHTTPEMAARAVAAIEARLDVVLGVAARLLPESNIPDSRAGERTGRYRLSCGDAERSRRDLTRDLRLDRAASTAKLLHGTTHGLPVPPAEFESASPPERVVS